MIKNLLLSYAVTNSKDSGKIEYCSIAEDDYKIPSFGLDDQLKNLKEKYGYALYDEKITKESDGSSSLSVRRKDKTGKKIVYFYFDSPKSCAEDTLEPRRLFLIMTLVMVDA